MTKKPPKVEGETPPLDSTAPKGDDWSGNFDVPSGFDEGARVHVGDSTALVNDEPRKLDTGGPKSDDEPVRVEILPDFEDVLSIGDEKPQVDDLMDSLAGIEEETPRVESAGVAKVESAGSIEFIDCISEPENDRQDIPLGTVEEPADGAPSSPEREAKEDVVTAEDGISDDSGWF
jgi:hypothetical protein